MNWLIQNWQTVVVVVCVVAAALVVLRSLFRMMGRANSGLGDSLGCGSCGSCSKKRLATGNQQIGPKKTQLLKTELVQIGDQSRHVR